MREEDPTTEELKLVAVALNHNGVCPTIEDILMFLKRWREKYGKKRAGELWQAAVASVKYINQISEDRERLKKEYPLGSERIDAMFRSDVAGFKKLQGASLRSGFQRAEDLEDALSKVVEGCLSEMEKDLEPTLAPLRKVLNILQKIEKNVQYRTVDAHRKEEHKRYKKEEGLKFGSKYDVPKNLLPLDALTFIDLVQKNILDIEEVIQRLENEALIREALSLVNQPHILTDRERQVLVMRFLTKRKNVTLEEVGRELEISRQSAHEREKRALKKISARLKRLKP